jgi:hypothetical protein
MYGASAHGLLFPAVPTTPIPPAGAQDPLQVCDASLRLRSVVVYFDCGLATTQSKASLRAYGASQAV